MFHKDVEFNNNKLKRATAQDGDSVAVADRTKGKIILTSGGLISTFDSEGKEIEYYTSVKFNKDVTDGTVIGTLLTTKGASTSGETIKIPQMWVSFEEVSYTTDKWTIKIKDTASSTQAELWSKLKTGKTSIIGTITKTDTTPANTIMVDFYEFQYLKVATTKEVITGQVYSRDFLDDGYAQFSIMMTWDTATSTIDAMIFRSQYADATVVKTHIDDTNNPHGVTKAQVELGNCDNTSDANKPISTLQQAEFDKKVDKVENYALSKITLNGVGNQAPTFFAPITIGEESAVQMVIDGKCDWKVLDKYMVFRGSKKGSELASGTFTIGDTYHCSESYVGTKQFTKDYVYTYMGTSGFSIVGNIIDLNGYIRKDEYVGQGFATGSILNTDADGKIAPFTDITTAQLKTWLNGTTSNIQMQIGNLQTQITNNKVSVTQVKTFGNAIGRITIGTNTTTFYETPVDSSMSSSSTNPVQNKVLKVEIDNLKNNKQDAVPAQGSVNQPVYTSSIGRFATCNQYAGGTAVSINGTSYASKSLSLTLTNSLIAFNEAPTINKEYTLGDSVTNYALVVIIYYTPSGSEFSSEIMMPDYNGKNIIHTDFDDKYAQVIITGNKFKFTKSAGGMYPCRVYGVLKKA